MFHFRGAAGHRGRRDDGNRPEFSFRAKTKISNRPLLRNQHGQDEQVLSTADGFHDKFRNLDELTDSDEADMEDSEGEQANGPSTKRVRLDEPKPEKPKWSNPDVYTSLPAPSETTGKKRDFVKLIRKARNTKTESTDPIANEEDFISFDNDDLNVPPANAPTGPKLHDTDRALGKRKRGEKTGAKLISRRGGQFYQDGMVLGEWRSRDGVHPTPWLRLHREDPVGLALHKEVLDFYDWVKPRDYEFQVRADVIDRISSALNRIEPGELKAFGSYAAGLYLPTGDMDLVYMLRGFNQHRGFHNGISPSQLRRYGEYIKKSGVAQSGSMIMIPKAKVPIIKFVERVSGLKVDLSFNNDTGVVAIETFQKWRDQYPAMPILVAVIKQFLMIRGLNDVAVGGLGGFSIICLVTSLLQHLPLSSHPPHLGEMLIEFFNLYGNLFDRHTVGIRMEPPAYVTKRSYQHNFSSTEKAGRLMIIDPNRADNNISGGTHEIETILNCLSRAHEVLINRVADYENHDHSSGHGFSFLEDLVGGDFTAYQAQRDILYDLYYGRRGPAPAVIPPPPPPIFPTRSPPPPPPPPPPPSMSHQPALPPKSKSKSAETTPGPQTSQSKGERRAARLKMLRPDLASVVGSRINLPEAVRIGGYQDYNEMDKDLTRREKELETNGREP